MAFSSPKTHELYSILFSHYNEAARWALDVAKIPYVEYGYLPLLHMIPVAWASGGGNASHDRASSRFSTPLLVLPDGKQLQDSRTIIKHADDELKARGEPSLLPTQSEDGEKMIADVTEVMDLSHDEIGVDARRIVYWYTLQDATLLRWMIDKNFSGVQHFIGSWTAPVIRYLIFRALNITQDRAMRSLERMRKNFDTINKKLQGKRSEQSFLAGTRFTAADLYFASIAAPVLGVSREDGYGAYLPPLGQLPPEGAKIIQEFRDHPAGQHALRVFKGFRGTRQIPYIFPEL
eukprot:gb/GECG01002169.1/.p1 GENE.gb/GECG01002169.1/~~gb/GECG01002169.1/.p1  ORF type:complete len:291 (+),score=28.09 gb/GECG01002169.1/:1-873(+)